MILCLTDEDEEVAEDATEETDSKQSHEGKVGKDDPSSDLSSPNSEPVPDFFSSINDINLRISEDIFVINARSCFSPAEELSGKEGTKEEGFAVLSDAFTAFPEDIFVLGDDKRWQALKVPGVATMPIKLLVLSAW